MQTVKQAKRVLHTRFTYSICTCEFYPIHFIHYNPHHIDFLPVPNACKYADVNERWDFTVCRYFGNSYLTIFSIQ